MLLHELPRCFIMSSVSGTTTTLAVVAATLGQLRTQRIQISVAWYVLK